MQRVYNCKKKNSRVSFTGRDDDVRCTNTVSFDVPDGKLSTQRLDGWELCHPPSNHHNARRKKPKPHIEGVRVPMLLPVVGGGWRYLVDRRW